MEKLNPKFFNEDNILNPKVRQILLSISKDIKKAVEKELGENIPWDHDILTGSLITVNYDDQSDIDLHLVVDYSKINKEKAKLIQKFLSAFFKNWNKENDITIFGHKVEVYPQDKNEPHFSENIYNLDENRFEGELRLQKIEANKEDLKKAKEYYKRAKELSLYKCISSEDCEEFYKKVKALWDEIKEMRKRGLAKATKDNPYLGLNSHENKVFKLLRRNKTLQMLVDLMRKTKKEIINKKLQEKKSIYYNNKLKSFKQFLKEYYPEYNYIE